MVNVGLALATKGRHTNKCPKHWPCLPQSLALSCVHVSLIFTINNSAHLHCSLENTIREDIVFIAFQFWVLGMSIVALLNESIPHILASLVTHVVATVWGSLQLVHTTHFRIQFGALITEGACRGVSQSPITSHYWDSRKSVEAVSLAFNVLALLVSCFLSWRLFKVRIFRHLGILVSKTSVAVWMADLQACRCIPYHQSDVQTCSHAINYHPTELFLCGRHCLIVVGSFV